MKTIYRYQPILHQAMTFTEEGTFNLEVEQLIGEAGADSATILDEKVTIQNYKKFVHYHSPSKREYVDITAPETFAYYHTFLLPASLAQESENQTARSLAPVVSLVAAVTLFASSYKLAKDIQTIKNANEQLKKTRDVKAIIKNVSIINPNQEKNHTYKSVSKIADLREEMYLKLRNSAIVSIALTIVIIASSIIAIVGACIALYPLLIASVSVAGAAITAHLIKSLIEHKNRTLHSIATQTIAETEFLRKVRRPQAYVNIESHLKNYYLEHIA